MAFSKEQVLEALKQVNFPEKKQDIVSLDMVEKIQITEEKISFSLIFPQFNNPFKIASQNCVIDKNFGLGKILLNIKADFFQTTEAASVKNFSLFIKLA